MISKDEAIIIAEAYVQTASLKSGNNLKIMSDKTRVFELGWIFFYQSKEYIETGDVYEMVGGNSPIIVNKYDASLSITGTAHPIEIYIEQYLLDHKV